MAILAASTVEPNMALSKRTNTAALIGPTGKFALHLHQAFASVSLFVLIRMGLAANLVLLSFLCTTRFVAFRSSLAMRFLALKAVAVVGWGCWAAWKSRTFTRFRKKVELELYALVVGPGGNTLFLLLFWPGWIILAVALWVMSMLSWF